MRHEGGRTRTFLCSEGSHAVPSRPFGTGRLVARSQTIENGVLTKFVGLVGSNRWNEVA